LQVKEDIVGKRILRTKLCDMLGIEYPIICAGMGPTFIGEETGAPVELVVAASEAGGMGVLGGSGFSIERLREAIQEIKAKTKKPYGVDLLLPQKLDLGGGLGQKGGPKELPLSAMLKSLPKPYQDWVKKVKDEFQLPDVEIMVKMDSTTMRPQEAIQVCIEERVPLFCAGLGNPGGMVAEAHAVGMKVLGITGNAKNARRMAQSGIDLLVAQGHEGGGHTGRIGTMALLPQAIDAAYPVPVLAAGGIGDGRGLAAALAMGCVGAWVGTRFLATNEGGALPVNKKHIIDSTDEDTRVSRAYTGKTLRASYNKFHDLWDGSGLEPLPFPTQVLISSGLLASFIEGKKDDYVGGLAGQISGLIKEIKPARQVLEEMVEEAVDILTHRLPENVKAQ
jgi:nitronate monooxygenase